MNRVLVPVLTTAGLVGGYWVARDSGVRAAGGAVLALIGAAVASTVGRAAGPARSAATTAAYLAAFGASHPLARRIGAWPSVGVVAVAAAIPGALLAEPTGAR